MKPSISCGFKLGENLFVSLSSYTIDHNSNALNPQLNFKKCKEKHQKELQRYLPTFIWNKAENPILLFVSCIAIDENLKNVANKFPDWISSIVNSSCSSNLTGTADKKYEI